MDSIIKYIFTLISRKVL